MEETPVLARPDSKTSDCAFALFKNIHLNTKEKKMTTSFCLSKKHDWFKNVLLSSRNSECITD